MKRKSNLMKSADTLIGNNTSGSSEIVQMLNGTAIKFIDDTRSLFHLCEKLNKEFGSFETVRDYVIKLQTVLIKGNRRELRNFIESYSIKHREKFEHLYRNAIPFLKGNNTILTISNSKTLLEVFSLWKKDKKSIHIIVCESRPNEEGKIFAEQLLEREIKTTLIADSTVNLVMKKCDAVIIGADMILKNGNVINKSGSSLLALSAKYFNNPVYVLADRSKLSRRTKYKSLKYPSNELWDTEHPFLSVENYYFEEVDKKLITKIITD